MAPKFASFSPFLVIGLAALVIAVLTFLLEGSWEVFIAILLLSIAAAFLEFVLPEIQRRKQK